MTLCRLESVGKGKEKVVRGGANWCIMCRRRVFIHYILESNILLFLNEDLMTCTLERLIC